MPCELHHLPIGAELTFSDSNIVCNKCGFETPVNNLPGRFMGHRTFPDGFCSVAELLEYVYCRACNHPMNRARFLCDGDSGLAESLFSKVLINEHANDRR